MNRFIIKVKNFLSDKKLNEYKQTQKQVEKTNRQLVLGLMKLYFHYYGVKITKKSGQALPHYNKSKDNDYEDFYNFKKQNWSEPVFILTEYGTLTAYYSYHKKERWIVRETYGDNELKVEKYFEGKYITENQLKMLMSYEASLLLGISDLEYFQKKFKEDSSTIIYQLTKKVKGVRPAKVFPKGTYCQLYDGRNGKFYLVECDKEGNTIWGDGDLIHNDIFVFEDWDLSKNKYHNYSVKNNKKFDKFFESHLIVYKNGID